MGGWIACHLALKYASRVAGLVGIAAAPDFLQDMWNDATSTQQKEWAEKGFVQVPTEYGSDPYTISMALVRDAEQHWNLLSKTDSSTEASIPIHCPVRLIHGKQDVDIDWTKSVQLMERVASNDVLLTLVKEGDHRLSRPQDLDRILKVLTELIDGTSL